MRKAPLLALAFVAISLAVPASAAAAPAWGVQALAAPTNFAPNDASGLATYEAFFSNAGDEPTDQSQITIVDILPAGLGVKGVDLYPPRNSLTDLTDANPTACEVDVVGEVSTVTCIVTDALLPDYEPARLEPGDQLRLAIHVSVPECPGGPSESCLLDNQVEVSGGGAGSPGAAEANNEISQDSVPPGFQELHSELTGRDAEPVIDAGSRPYQYVNSFAVNLVEGPPGAGQPFLPAGGDLRKVEIELPPGLAGNPTSIKSCTIQEFNTLHGVFSTTRNFNAFLNDCPDGSAVGMVMLQGLEGAGALIPTPIYNLVPPKGMPAQLGFQIVGAPVYIDTKVRSADDYGFTGIVRDITQAKRVTAARTVIWGTPADASHDTMRGNCLSLGGACPAELGDPRPFFRLPTSCTNPLLYTMSFETWGQPPTSAVSEVKTPTLTDCAALDFSPTIESRPTTNVADSPSGLHFNLHLPQEENEDPEERGEADLRDATVTLPRGLLVNPASADGLAACSSVQIGLTTPLGQLPPHFSEESPSCPNAAKIGSVEVATPLLEDPLPGSVYLAKQGDNPFGSLLAIYIVIDDPETGIVAKIAGKVTPDPVSGQLTTIVTASPQVPFEDFTFNFFAGARASLRTPPACGTYVTTTEMVPWSAPEGAAVAPSDSFQIVSGPGGPCPSGALSPKLSAGLANPTAGTYSPFSLRLTREDASDEFAGLTASPPLGLVAKLAGIPYCSEAAIAVAISRSGLGQGVLEATSPSCPSASRVGSTTAGAGAGSAPFYTAGELYLAGPYKGAPLSLVAIIPAVAGPFDLGVVVNRIAVRVNPETAQVTTETDPLPRILSGIPLDVRDIRAVLDRPNFTLAPTGCEPKSVTANVLGTSGASTAVSDRFQVGGCDALGFKPGISLKLSGGIKRSANPRLKAVVTYPKGAYSNIARASVALPHSEFLDQSHIRTICTRVQFAAGACPKGSIYGKARATTPLLDAPLEGPVYLRSSNNPLPDMVMALRGQIDVDLVGRIDSRNGGIRTTFDAVPDAPVTKFTLEMRGGKRGLLENSRNICKHTNRAAARLTAHSGRTYNFRPVLRSSSCKKRSGKRPSSSRAALQP